MLNKSKLLPIIYKLINNDKNALNNIISNIKNALSQYENIKGNEAIFIRKLKASKTSWLTAIPLENFNDIKKAKINLNEYSVIAIDGSQIMPDRHEVRLCYLINIGYVILHYGEKSFVKMESEPTLFFSDDDLYKESNGFINLVTPKDISFKRTIMEYNKIIECLKYNINNPKIAFIDGTLIEWMVQGDPNEQSIINSILAVFESAKRLHTPIIGYISSPNSNDFVNMLKVSLCPYESPNCSNCMYMKSGNELPCSKINNLNDAEIFSKILNSGERSPLFLSTSHILDKYGDNKIAFFYLNTGNEIARIELPQWIIYEENLIDLIHFICYDQAKKGLGYPISLQEAHEQAVVTGSERDAFYHMLSSYFIKNGLKVYKSYKSQRKRSGLL